MNHVPASALVAAVHKDKRARMGDLMKRIAELERQLAKGGHGGGPARGGKGRESNPDLGKRYFFCLKLNHVAKNCRLKLKKLEENKQSEDTVACGFEEPWDPVDDQDSEGMTQDDVYCRMVDGFNPDDYQVLGAKEVEDAVMHTQASAWAMFSDTEVLWDCAAGRSLVSSKALLGELRTAQEPVRQKSFVASEAGLSISEEAPMAALCGRHLVSYHPGAYVNVLSQGGMDDGHHVKYDREADEYQLDGHFTFRRNTLPDGRKGKHYVCDFGAAHERADVVGVETVSENLRTNPTREVKAALVAREFQRRLGNVSSSAAAGQVHRSATGELSNKEDSRSGSCRRGKRST